MSSNMKTPVKEHFVYVLCDPRKPGPYKYGTIVFTHRPFYVGKGKGDRPYSHTKEAINTQRKNHKLNTIRAILENGLEPIVAKSQSMTESEATQKEVLLISMIGRVVHGGILTNGTDGGDGISGHKHSEATSRKLSKAQQRLNEERPDLREAQIKALREYFRDSDKAKAMIASKKYSSEVQSKAASKFWNEADKEAIKERNRKVSESHAKRSKAEKEKTSLKKQQSWAGHSKEYHDDIQNRRQETLRNRPIEEQARTKALQAAATAQRHAENRAKKLPDELVLKIRRLNKTMGALPISKLLNIPISRVLWVTSGKFRPDLQP